MAIKKKKNIRNPSVISDKLIEIIRQRLSDGKQVRRTLPRQGRIHIDRMLPFLVVYRRPMRRNDTGTEQLIKGEASYLIASSSPRMKSSLNKLIRVIAEVLTKENEPFLLIEIWSGRNSVNGNENEQTVCIPGFKIFTPRTQSPTRTVEAFRKSLRKIRIQKHGATVEVIAKNIYAPEKMAPIITTRVARKMGWYVIGLEINPVYCNQSTGDLYPLLLRLLHRYLSRAFKQAVFEFLRGHTTVRPRHYLALGRSRPVKAVWEVDKQLAEISSSFDFLLQVSPTNTEAARARFRSSRFEKAPILEYRPVPVDPSIIKRDLYKIPIENIEDPILASVFHEKRLELDKKLTMLEYQETPEFLYGSLQLYGKITPEEVDTAKSILKKISAFSRDEVSRTNVNAAEFRERAKEEIEYYSQFYPGSNSDVNIRDDVNGLIVSRGDLLVGSQLKIPTSRVEALIHHEVGTHVLTYLNGKFQPFRQLYSGLAGYEETQEGLATLAEYIVGGLTRPRLRLLAGRVIAVDCLVRGANFVETFRELDKTYEFNQDTAFSVTTRVFRGGGLTKDAVYLRGLTDMLKYIQDGNDLEILYCGKIALSHVPLIRELLHRQILKHPPLRPRYLDNSLSSERLQRLKTGLSIIELMEKRKRK